MGSKSFLSSLSRASWSQGSGGAAPFSLQTCSWSGSIYCVLSENEYPVICGWHLQRRGQPDPPLTLPAEQGPPTLSRWEAVPLPRTCPESPVTPVYVGSYMRPPEGLCMSWGLLLSLPVMPAASHRVPLQGARHNSRDACQTSPRALSPPCACGWH